MHVMTDEHAPSAAHGGDTGPPDREETWRRILMGDDRSLPRLRRLLGAAPSAPRCKMCAAPFRGPGGLIAKAFRHGPSRSNPLLCSACFGQIRKMPGGADGYFFYFGFLGINERGLTRGGGG